MIKIHLTPKWRKILVKYSVLAIGAILLTIFLQYRTVIYDAGKLLNFIFGSPLVFLYNSFLMFLIAACLDGIIRRPFFNLALLLSSLIIISYVNINKFVIRGTPLLPEDFQLAEQASSLSKFIDFGSIFRVIFAIIIIFITANVLTKLTKDWFEPISSPDAKNWWRRHHLTKRFTIIAVAFAIFLATTSFIRHHPGERTARIDCLDTSLVAWNQAVNYEKNGFIVGFLYNLSKFQLNKPDGYSEEKILSLRRKYTKQKKQDEKINKRSSLKKAEYNIVTILNESFIDATRLKGQYDFDGDVMPNTRRIAAQHPSGFMYSLDYGGGTANMEFESDTSLTNYWANTVPFTSLLPKLKAIPSIASYAKQNGYETVAIHPFNGGMYKRNIALKTEGFDRFITESEMSFKEKDANSQYINDRSAYNQVLKEIKTHKKKQMISLATMQNHSPYNPDLYPEFHFKIKNMDDEPEKKASVESFLETMYQSDKYFGEFIAKLDKMKEKTVVVFYGDHSPGVFEKTNDHSDKKIRDLARETPHIIYANFKLHDDSGKNGRLPTTTPNCFNNTLFDVLNVKKPAYLYLVDKVCKETPILTQAYYGESAPFKSTTLSEYELLTYDILGGKRYWTQK